MLQIGWVLLTALLLPAAQASASQCLPVMISFCRDAGYRATLHPGGVAGHNTGQLRRIVETRCSPLVAQFLCRVLVPPCHGAGQVEPRPCRHVCQRVKDDCEPALRRTGLSWPHSITCGQLPEQGCSDCQRSRKTALLFSSSSSPEACEPVIVPLCGGLPYNLTALPNALGHATQEEALLDMHQFYPFVELQCSANLRPFLCSVYVPECADGRARAPCRALCEEARAGCEPLMERFGFAWPDTMRCDALSYDSCRHFEVSRTWGSCQPITIPMCQGIPYNQTIMPNLLGHKNQREAAIQMSFFHSLVKSVCSIDIRDFLCLVYAPKCVAGEVQRPCRSLCEQAAHGCGTLMNNFGVPWPEELRCDAFPEEMCVGNSKPEELNVEEVLAKLNEQFSDRGHGESLTLQTASLLVTFKDADHSGKLNVTEFLSLKRYVEITRRAYLESYDWKNPGFISNDQMRNALILRDLNIDEETFGTLWHRYSHNSGLQYEGFLAVLTKLHILKDRFKANQMNLPCPCKIASFTFSQLVQAAYI